MAAITTTYQSYNGSPLPSSILRRRFLISQVSLLPVAGTITTYYYRTLAYVRGSTTTPGSWPVGSVVERVVTS